MNDVKIHSENPKVHLYLDALDKVEKLERLLSVHYGSAAMEPMPESARPAKQEDMIVGRVIWYPEREGRKWDIVMKAEGNSLDGCYVEDV